MDPEVNAHLPLNPREYLILFALTSGPSHGYGLIKDIEHETEGQVALDPANLYRSIKRLIRVGRVQPAERSSSLEAGKERRRYYEITRLGRRVAVAEAERLDRLAALARERKLIPDRGHST